MRARGMPAALAAAGFLFAIPGPAVADHLHAYSYNVLRDGKPVGRFQVEIEDQGEGQRIDIIGDVEVTIGPITLYRLAHRRREIWRDDVLIKSTAHTDKNGDVFDIEITREADGYKRVINGRVDKFDPAVKVLALWHDSLFTAKTFISSYEDDVMSISVDYQGRQEITLGGRRIMAKHYKMTGDSERDLWFDATGHVVKMQFSEMLSQIAYELDAEPLTAQLPIGMTRRVTPGPPSLPEMADGTSDAR